MSNSEIIIIALPLIILQLSLMIISLVHIFRHDNYKVGNRLLWVLVVVFINLFGPILYFAIGRGE